MKKFFTLGLLFAILLSSFSACNIHKNKDSKGISNINLINEHILTSSVLTADQQARLTPQQVLDTLKKGNRYNRLDRPINYKIATFVAWS